MWLAICLCAVLGLVVGSFLNVVIARVPAGRSVVSPPSACPVCGHPIRPRDNIPVLSWLLLRGHCRDCSAPISARYPLVELGTAALFALAGWRFGFDAALPVFLFLAALSIALSAIDLDTKRLPNRIVLPAYPIAVGLGLLTVIENGTWPLVRAVIGGAILAAIYLGLWVVTSGKGIGYGDVKLAGLVGGFAAYLGWGALVIGGFGAFVLGAAVGVTLLAVGRAGRTHRDALRPLHVRRRLGRDPRRHTAHRLLPAGWLSGLRDHDFHPAQQLPPDPSNTGEQMLKTRRKAAAHPEKGPAASAPQAGAPVRLAQATDQSGLAHVDLRQETPDPAALALLSGEAARRLGVVPLRLDGERLVVAVGDPDPAHLAAVQAEIGRQLVVCVAPPAQVARVVDNNYRALTSVGDQVAAFETRDSLRRAALAVETAQANDDAPVVRVVQMVLTQGLRDRASDIHIEPQGERVRVRYRIDGALHDVLDLPGSIGPALVSRIKIMGGMNIVERRRPQDGQIAVTLEGREVDIRVSTTATIWGEKVVMRLLDKSRTLHKLSDLGMPLETAERYSKIIRSPYGMVVCAGPTGSGKTTTLYGSLSEINDPTRNITTIEDPVEYVFPSINQIQINEQAGVTFANGLKSILRQDPDVILIGEVRDAETARIAVQSALTGHFVLSSLHATDSASALHRLLDMEIEPFLVASSVSAVVSQRLMRRICGYCREPYKPTSEELAFYDSVGGQVPANGFWAGTGCNFCANTGYSERIGVYELLVVSEEIKDLVLRRAPHAEVRRLARTQGLRTLQEEAVRLVADDVTTIAEVLRSIYAVGA